MVAYNEDLRWQALAKEIEETSGREFSPDDIKRIEFCYEEVGKLGFSMSITFLPDWHFKNAWKERDRTPTQEELEQLGSGKYSYQLLGGIYEERGNHPCPLLDSPQLAAATALFNVCHLRAAGKL
jgi:hypothetical protein